MSQKNIVAEEASIALWAGNVITFVSRTMRVGMASEMARSGKYQAAFRAFVSPAHLQSSISQTSQYRLSKLYCHTETDLLEPSVEDRSGE